MTEALPLPVTALLGACLCVLLEVADAKTVFAPFADPIVFLFIGSFMLARAMTLHALDRRIALAFLSVGWIGGRPALVLAALGLVTALLSMWVSNTATTAMMMPIALGVLHALYRPEEPDARESDLQPRARPYATAMMLVIAYGASIGGIGTPVGSPPNLIGIGLIRDLAGVDINFFRWMALTLPLFLLMLAVLLVLLCLLHPAPAASGHKALGDLPAYLRSQRRALGGWTAGQVNTLIAFGVAVTLWIVPGVLGLILGDDHRLTNSLEAHVPESVGALLAAGLLFVLPTRLRRHSGEVRFTITWNEAAKIDWGTILLFGGGLSLGTLMFNTGVAEVLGRGVTQLTGASTLWGLTAVAVAMGIFLSETASNTASANMVIPVVIALAQTAGINPVPPALGACLGASYGFMLPVSTPPNAIVYGTGLVPITKMMRAGILFDACGFVIIVAGLRVLCPLLGLA
jgi:sodium-dependent dicarboxylate transporter 2/3/5